MALTKKETDLLVLGNAQEFWRFASDQDCNYETISGDYDAICTLIEEGEEWGTDGNGDPIDITGYPIRQRPPIRPSY